MVIVLIFFEQQVSRYSNNQFMTVNDCVCRGYNVTYQCPVFGGATTVWRGTAFVIDCPFINNEIYITKTSNL